MDAIRKIKSHGRRISNMYSRYVEHINCDINNKIKQLRWDNKKLVGYKFYETFTKEET